jgi:hypothetical protein
MIYFKDEDIFIGKKINRRGIFKYLGGNIRFTKKQKEFIFSLIDEMAIVNSGDVWTEVLPNEIKTAKSLYNKGIIELTDDNMEAKLLLDVCSECSIKF